MGNKGYATSQLDAVPKEKSQQITCNLLQLHQKGKPQTNEELSQRINDYLIFCGESSIRPGIESLCMALHISRTTLFRWSHGEDCDRQRQELVNDAKTFIASWLEQASLSGAVNPATAIFLQKNWFSYKDTISLEEATGAEPIIQKLSNTQLAARLGSRIQNYTVEQEGDIADD